MSAEAIPEVEIEDNASYVIDSQDDFIPERLTTPGASQDPIKDYLRGIAKVDLLDAALEVELSKSIEAGLFSEQLLTIREADDPLEYLQGAKGGKDSADLASDPESFFNSREFTLGQSAARLAMQVSDEELRWMADDGTRAKKQMQEANLRLVVSIGKRYIGRGMPYLDVIQEGNLGLLHGVEKFDFAKGYKFSTYASWWIKQSISRALDEKNRIIRIPFHMVEKINAMVRVERELMKAFDREPTIEELAEELQQPRERIIAYKGYSHDVISLDAPVGDGGTRYDAGATLGELIEDADAENVEETVEFSMLQKALLNMLDSLPEREAGIIIMRFGLTGGKQLTCEEVGKIYGVGRERIRQIEAKTLSKLRHPSRSGRLRDYLR